jgi:hypothetical protein
MANVFDQFDDGNVFNQFDEPEVKTPVINFGDPLDGMPEEERSVVEPLMSEEDKQMVNATNFYNDKFSTNHTPEMVMSQIQYEYGENATPAIANEKNNILGKMAAIPGPMGFAQRFMPKKIQDIQESFIRRTGGSLSQLPIMGAEQAELYGERSKWVADKMSFGNEKASKVIHGYLQTLNPSLAPQRLLEVAGNASPEAVKALEDFGRGQVDKAGEIQSEHLSGESFVDLAQNGEWGQIGKDLATMIAFEVPNLVTQISLATASSGGSLAFMGATSAGGKRAEKTEEDSLAERVFAPIATGFIEILTEKLIGTQRVLDKIAAGEIKSGFVNRILQVATDFAGGMASEGGAQFGGNVVDRLSGEDVALSQGVVEAMSVGGFMDMGTSMLLTPGDANRLRKQNTDAQLDEKVANGELTQEVVDVVKTPENEREGAVDAYNENIMTPETAGEQLQEPGETAQEVGEPTGYMANIETMDDIQNINRSKSRVMNKVLTPFREVVGNISPQMKTRIDKWEFDTHQRKKDYTERSTTFLEGASKLAKEDSAKFTEANLALKNGRFDEAEKILGKETMDEIRNVTEEIGDEMNRVGYQFERREDYFPRRVKDLKGLRNELGKEMGNQIDDAIAEQQQKAKEKGYTLSDMEISKIINNVINGSYRPIGGRKPKSLKQRSIEEVTPELDKYYYDAVESWIMHINEASDIIEMRKLLGKDIKIDGDVVDMNESIGEVVRQIRDREGLNEQEVNELIGALRARLGYRATGKVWQAYRSMTAMTTLGQFSNALTQLGDFTWSFYENGLFDTLGGAGDVISQSGITMKDLGIDEMSAEFRTPNGMHDAVDKLFKYTGLKAIDRLGKETLANSSLRQYQQMAKNDSFTQDKQDKLDSLFGAEQDRVIEDLKNGERTKDVDLLIFSTLLDWHPTTLSNMPQAYLEHPNGRVLYTLKTFTVKQLDNFRRIAVDDMIEGVATKDVALASRGFGKLMKLAGIMLASNVPIDLLKDWLTGKDIEFSDTVLDNLFKLFGFSRYNAWRATRRGQKVSESLLREFLPPFPWLDYVAEDIKTITEQLNKGDDVDLMNLESWNMLPFYGRGVYWRYGKGEEKEEKRRKEGK